MMLAVSININFFAAIRYTRGRFLSLALQSRNYKEWHIVLESYSFYAKLSPISYDSRFWVRAMMNSDRDRKSTGLVASLVEVVDSALSCRRELEKHNHQLLQLFLSYPCKGNNLDDVVMKIKCQMLQCSLLIVSSVMNTTSAAFACLTLRVSSLLTLLKASICSASQIVLSTD